MVAHPSITQGVQCQQETIYYSTLTADADLRRPTRGDVNEVVDSMAEDAVHQRVGALEHRPNHAHQSVSNNRKSRSRQLYQVISKILVFEGSGLASWSMSFPAAIIVGAYYRSPRRRREWRVQMRDQGGGRGPGHTGNIDRRAYVATFRFGEVQPSSPSACRAAASRSARHSA